MPSAAPKQRTAAPTRKRVLDVATELLVRKGPAELTVRDVATAAHCSTMMIYTWFGGKDELIEAVYRDGFARLEAALGECAAERDPIAHVRALAHAYRRFGLRQPVLYAAMFSRPMAPEHVQGRHSRRETASFTTLLDAVRAALERGAVASSHGAETIADVLWAAVHGHVSLEVTGHFAEDSEASGVRFALLVDACLSGMATSTCAPRSAATTRTTRRR
jgi:AcrR family transcriptional regulator